MGPFADLVLDQLIEKYRGLKKIECPDWLVDSRWNPAFCLARSDDKRIYAIDLVPSAKIPRSIYKGEVLNLKKKHKNLRIIVCVLDELLGQFPDAEKFCSQMGYGLQSYIPEVGLQTIVLTDLDNTYHSAAEVEAGWFPKQILEKAEGLTNLSFHNTLDSFLTQITPIADNESAVLKLVKLTIGQLLQYYPKCHPDVGSFMKLEQFERLYRRLEQDAADHVLHSFRVFLAGCAIISRFRKVFKDAHKRLCVCSARTLSVEYCWLLTAIYHDIGYPQEKVKRLLEAQLDDEDLDISVQGSERRWQREKYVTARRILSSLGMFISTCTASEDKWDGGSVPGRRDGQLSSEWTRLYDQMSSHSVIGAFNMLASILEQASAVDEQKNHAFVLTHAAPAALAILLHDHRIWDELRKWRLFPIDAGYLPMAALLVFIDTWDDFKRRGLPSPISIESFDISNNTVTIAVKWLKADEYEKEKVKYEAFKRALKNRQINLRIRAAVAT